MTGKTCKPITPRMLEVGKIDNGPFPWDVRGDDATDHVQRLARSLELNGGILEHPIIVRPHPTLRGRYQRISGKCRLAAAVVNGRTDIPSVIRELSDGEARLAALTENLARRDPGALLKLGWVILPLAEEPGVKQKALAEMIGCVESKISDALKYARAIPEEAAEQIALAAGTGKEVIGRLPRPKLKAIEKMEPAQRTQALLEICRAVAEGREVTTVPDAGTATVGIYELDSDGQRISLSIPDLRLLAWTELIGVFLKLAQLRWSGRHKLARRSEAGTQEGRGHRTARSSLGPPAATVNVW